MPDTMNVSQVGRIKKTAPLMEQTPTPTPQDGAKILGALLSLGAFAYMGYMFYGGGVQKEATESMRSIEQQVATDSEAQYNITKQSGTAIDRCVHAGMTAAAYLQANDQSSYANWKEVERRDCDAAGMPR
jgi:hypothetical protein